MQLGKKSETIGKAKSQEILARIAERDKKSAERSAAFAKILKEANARVLKEGYPERRN